MILQELVRLAAQRNLNEDTDYQKQGVDFVLRLRADGSYLSLEPRRDEKGKGQMCLVPRMPKRSSGVAASFAFDNAKYVLGLDDPEKAKPRRLGKYVAAFSERIREAAEATGDSALKAAAGFYTQLADNQRAVLADRPAAQWDGSENLAIALEGDELLLHERGAVRAYWASLREESLEPSAGGEAGALLRCLITGQPSPAVRLHGSVKGLTLYGGQPSGTSLVSFNPPAFTSHGFVQGQNAPVSRAAAEAYVTALNWLLERPTGSKRLHRYGVRVGETAVTVFWSRESHKALDAFTALWNGPDEQDVESFYRAPFTGLEPGELDEAAFFALCIGGNSSRLVVRDWLETTIGKVKTNLRQYFGDLAIGVGQPRPLAMWQILAALDPPGEATLAPDLGARIYRGSVTGVRLPRELLRYAVLRLRVPPDKEPNARSLFHQRVALTKAVLCGLARHDPNLSHLEVQVALDENKTDTAYVLGRLFAVIEWIQAAAQGDLNKTIRDRYFGSASTTPGVVMGRLLKLSTHHEAKVGGGLRHLFDERKRQIIRLLGAAPFPSHLSLEAQGLFAVGYYHERDALFTEAKRRKLEKEIAEAAEGSDAA